MDETWTVKDSPVVVATLTCILMDCFLLILKHATEIYNTLQGVNINWVS
jgi:hypothetical protein